jgi:LuxR family maltose regulon positive regulatory protein
MPRVARIVSDAGAQLYRSGHADTVDEWLRRFPDEAPLDRYPDTAALGGWIHAARGRPEDAERWLDAAERGTTGPRQRRRDREDRLKHVVVRAAMCRGGADRMLADAESAAGGLAPDSRWYALAMALRGTAHLLRDDPQADEALADAAEAAERTGAPEAAAIAMGERAFAAHAEQIATTGRDLVAGSGLSGYPTSALVLAASARTRLRHGHWAEARDDLEVAERLRDAVSETLPWLAAQVRLELAAAHVTLRDATGARALVDEASETIARGPRLAVLSAQAERLRREVDEIPDGGDANSSGLTAAELRLLPLLATHLTFREIGEQLFVSRNTIKTQAISVYRKLGVSSRSDAITRARELGLVEDATGGGRVLALPRR